MLQPFGMLLGLTWVWVGLFGAQLFLRGLAYRALADEQLRRLEIAAG